MATLEWSSPNYDYMVVDGEKYLPVNTEGNSVFQIPVEAFDQDIAVIADTVAMSTPHEIEYTLNFHAGENGQNAAKQIRANRKMPMVQKKGSRQLQSEETLRRQQPPL